MSSSYQRTEMPSSFWMNGQQQQAGQASQAASQQAFYLMRNRQTGNTNSPCRYQTVNVGGQQAQNANFTFQDGANRQTPNWQTSLAQHQAASLQQPTGGRNNGSTPRFQNLNNSPQSGNLYLPYDNGAQVANQQQFHHSSFLNPSTQTPHGMKMAKASYAQQDMFYRKDPVSRKQTGHTQDGNVVRDLQYYKGQGAVPQNVNADARTVALHKQAAGTSSPVSDTAPQGQSVHSQNPRQNTQDTLLSSLPPSYQDALFQVFGNTSNSLSSSQNFNVANLNQRTQQYPPQLNTEQNAGKQTYTFGDSVQRSYAAASNQATQPTTSTVVQTFHSTTQPLPYYYTHFKLKTRHHSVTSGAQRVADGSSVTTTGNRSGNNKKADGGLSIRNRAGSSLSALRHLAQMAERISSQNDAQSFAAYSPQPCDVPDHLQSMAPSDSSLHMSPGRTGTRAVAVVQPLSQETCLSGIPSPCNTSQPGECTTTDESSCSSGKSCILPDVATSHQAAYSGEDTEVCSVNANQIRSSERPITQPAASSISTAVSSSNSPEPHALLKKLLTSRITEANHSIYLKAQQSTATVFQKPVHAKVQESKQSDVDETPVDLSSVQTTPWTKDMLIKLIQEEKKYQKDIQHDAFAVSMTKLWNIFWGSDAKMLQSHLKVYTALMEEVKEFFHKQVTKDSIILSQVKLGFEEELKKYHVVKNSDIYTAPPYKSSWLNVNQQLDDIDKEFGFPWSLTYGLDTLKSGRQPDQDGPNDNAPAQTAIERTDDVSISTSSATVDSGDEKQPLTPVTTSNESLSPSKTGSAVSNEPHYSFNIEVLSPEEAKRIFQQVQSRKQQDMDMDSQPEEVMDTSLEGQMHEVSDIPVMDLLVETSPKEVCCIARALETVGGSQVPFTSKCQCKKEQRSQTDGADEATATQKNDEVCLIESDANSHSTLKEEIQVISCTLFNHSELCSEEIIDLTEDDSSLCFAEDLNNTSYVSISDSQSSASEIEDTELKSAGSSPSRSSDTSEREIEKVSSDEVASQMSNGEEDCAQDEQTSTDVLEYVDSPQTTPQMNDASSPQTVVLHGERETAEQQQTGAKSPDLKPVSKAKGYVNNKSPTTKTVELVLFGSSPQEKSPGRRTKSVTFQSGKSAPKLLCVKVSSRDRAFMTKDPVYPGTYSVKQRIHEEWKKSFPPINMKLKKVKKSKSKHSWSTSSTESPASSGNAWNKNAKLSLKTRRSLCTGGKMMRNAVARGPHADKSRHSVEGEPSCPPKKKFTVSPKSFLWSG